MSDFFRGLIDKGLINDWGNILDWIFNDERFDNNGWNSSYIGLFAKKIQKIEKISENFQHGSIKNLNFPILNIDKTSIKTYVIFADDNGIGRSIIKHIRNGIAHGMTRYIKTKNELYIEIKDYSDDKKTKQTAYIYFPMRNIIDIYNVYKEVEKSINNNRPRGRKEKNQKRKEFQNA